MRLLTPEVDHALEWFHFTHQLDAVGMGVPQWHRICLPSGTDLEAQDALLMQQLSAIAECANARLLDRARKGDPRKELEEFHEKNRRH